RQGPTRRGSMSLALERAPNRSRARLRRTTLGARFSFGDVARRLPACTSRRGALLRRREFDAGAPRLGETDRDRLFGRSRAMLALADVMHLLAHEFAGLSTRCFPFALVLVRAFDRFSFWHETSLVISIGPVVLADREGRGKLHATSVEIGPLPTAASCLTRQLEARFPRYAIVTPRPLREVRAQRLPVASVPTRVQVIALAFRNRVVRELDSRLRPRWLEID